MSSRGIPEQHKLENQDPDVLFNVDQMTGKRTKLDPPKKAARKESSTDAPKGTRK